MQKVAPFFGAGPPTSCDYTMATDAQKAARDKWNRENKKTVTVGFYPADADLLEWLNNQPQKGAYIKALIRKDMERNSK